MIESQTIQLTALADGSLTGPGRLELELAVARDPVLAAALARLRAALARIAAAVHVTAPDALKSET